MFHKTGSSPFSFDDGQLFCLQDAAFLVDNVNRKANLDDVATIETNLMQVTRQLSRLNEVIQEQNSTIRELNHRVTLLQEEVEDVRNPNFQQIFTYIDKQVRERERGREGNSCLELDLTHCLYALQVNKVASEMSDRLAEKADTRDVERSIPQKVEEVYRNILSQMNSLHKDLGRTVTKDEFHQFLATKVGITVSLIQYLSISLFI
jgi:septal ring factor EnvC (AmiA/AmiB activator)